MIYGKMLNTLKSVFRSHKFSKEDEVSLVREEEQTRLYFCPDFPIGKTWRVLSRKDDIYTLRSECGKIIACREEALEYRF